MLPHDPSQSERPGNPLEDLSHIKRSGPSPEYLNELRERMLARHDELTPRVRRFWPWALPATAGGAIAAMLCIMILLWPRPAATFGSVQERLRSINTMSCVAHLVVEDTRVPADVLTITTWADAAKGVRTQARVLGVPVISSLALWGHDILLMNELRGQMAQLPADQSAMNHLRDLDPTRLILELRNQAGISAVPLGQQNLDGEDVDGYRLEGWPFSTRPGTQVTIWVAKKSGLPVKVQCRLPATDHGTIDFVIDQFRWDEPLAAGLFDMPQYRQVARAQEVIARPSESIMIAGLRDFAQYSGGYYPGHSDGNPSLFMLVLKLRGLAENGGNWAQGNSVDAIMYEKLILGGTFLLNQASRGHMPDYDGQIVLAGDGAHELVSWSKGDGTRVRYNGKLELIPDAGALPATQPK